MKWRAENDIENTLAAFLPDGKDDIVRKHIPSGFVGFDKSVRVGCHASHADWLPCSGELTARAVWQSGEGPLQQALTWTDTRGMCFVCPDMHGNCW